MHARAKTGVPVTPRSSHLISAEPLGRSTNGVFCGFVHYLVSVTRASENESSHIYALHCFAFERLACGNMKRKLGIGIVRMNVKD
jgi:hypothetical protein